MKAGFISKQHEKQVVKVSAWAEAIGYAANILISCHKLHALNIQEQRLRCKIEQLMLVRADMQGCGSA